MGTGARSLSAGGGSAGPGGANEDGAYGLTRVKRRGGVTIAQDPATAERRDMPAAAIATGAVDHVLPLEEIGPKLGELVAA